MFFCPSVRYKRVGIMSFCPSVINKGVGFYIPSLGEGLGVGVKPTPTLPKGGSLNEAQYSLTSNRLTSNGHYPPSLGEGQGWAPTPLFLGGCTAGYCGLKILISDSGG